MGRSEAVADRDRHVGREGEPKIESFESQNGASRERDIRHSIVAVALLALGSSKYWLDHRFYIFEFEGVIFLLVGGTANR